MTTMPPTAMPPPGTPGTPTSTYRLQIQPGFPFAAAARAVPYLAALGLSHLHLSPVLQAVPGSTHGYDVVDHSRVSDELGGEAGLRALSATAREHGMGLVLDVVPNHMAVPVPETLNAPLWSVLRDGPESPYARWFDIDWAARDGRVLLPVLGGRLGTEPGSLRVGKDDALGQTVVRYHDHAFPVRPGTEHLPLHRLLDAQHYRLCWWRLARTELNYRRFFTISDLIGVRAEDPEVFGATHAKLLELLSDGVADGLRIDHPDGLADPAGYLRRLREATGGRWTVVEKILAADERLPGDWACAGTTGYDALHRVDGLFTDPAGSAAIAKGYRSFTGAPGDRGGEWAATARRAAYRVVTDDLAAEVDRLGRAADRVCAADPALRDHAPWALRAAIREILVRLPNYRPYVVPGEPPPGAAVRMLQGASVKARRTFAVREEADAADVVRDLALGRLGRGPDQDDFLVRFPQVSSALRAKSVEDTAFYRWYPLLSANEVGGEPGRPPASLEDFHDFCARLQRDWPATGTVLSTHDTKRSADSRAVIAVLAELPGRWLDWLRERDAQTPAPDRHVAYLVWQTAVGLGFCHPDRLVPVVLKAVREAGLRTSWTNQDAEYEAAVKAFVEAGPCGPQAYAVGAFAAELAPYSRANVLGAALTHLTMPGVPDVYQGTEFPVRTLVDPDNRAPFDGPIGGEPRFGRGTVLRELDNGRAPRHLDEEKLWVTASALRLRRARPEWFGEEAGYEPLRARGPAAGHCVAFARTGGAITVVTRLPYGLAQAGGWGATELPLPSGHWRDALTGREAYGSVRLAELLGRLPVALLVAA